MVDFLVVISKVVRIVVFEAESSFWVTTILAYGLKSSYLGGLLAFPRPDKNKGHTFPFSFSGSNVARFLLFFCVGNLMIGILNEMI